MGHSFNRFQKPPLRWQLCVTCASESMTGEPIITQYRGHWFQDVSSQTKSLSVYLSRKPWKVHVLHPIHHGFTADVVWNHHLTAYPCCRKSDGIPPLDTICYFTQKDQLIHFIPMPFMPGSISDSLGCEINAHLSVTEIQPHHFSGRSLQTKVISSLIHLKKPTKAPAKMVTPMKMLE